MKIGVAENLGREALESCSRFPGFRRQAGFATGLFEESASVPVVLDRNLREKKSAMTAQGHYQPVPTNFDLLRFNR